MITLLEVKTQMAECLEQRQSATERPEINRLKKKYIFLKLMHDYVLESPSEDYLKFSLKRLLRNIEVINKRFIEDLGRPEHEMAKAVLSERRKIFDKQYGVKDIKNQIKALKYILKN